MLFFELKYLKINDQLKSLFNLLSEGWERYGAILRIAEKLQRANLKRERLASTYLGFIQGACIIYLRFCNEFKEKESFERSYKVYLNPNLIKLDKIGTYSTILEGDLERMSNRLDGLLLQFEFFQGHRFLSPVPELVSGREPARVAGP